MPYFAPVFLDDPFGLKNDPAPANPASGPYDLMLNKTPDAALAAPPPIFGLLNTPWINGAVLSTGTNAVPAGAVVPVTPEVAPGVASSGGASGNWGATSSVGTPLGSFGWGSELESWFTGYNASDLQAEGHALDDSLTAMNAQALANGTIDDATYNATVQHLATQIAATQGIPDDINAAWVDGALEGYKSDLAVLNAIPKYAGKVTGDVLGAITRGAGSGVASLLGSLPWWLYLGGAIALFVYLGGGKAVEYQARKRIARYSR